MPRGQYDALERCGQAQRDWGVDSDESTIQVEDEDQDNSNDPQEDAIPLEARICQTTVDMFKQVLLFSQGAGEALYNNQMATTLDVLQDLTNNIIKELCHAIRKPGGDGPGHQISELSVTCLKLFAFWARHMWRTSRGVDDWTDTTYDKIRILTNQKTLEDSLLDTKPTETPAVTLEPHLVTKAFNDMLILLGKMQGIAEHPFSYVLRPNLKGSNNVDPDDETEDPLPFGQSGSPYVSINNKLCRRVPILRTDLTHFQISVSLETLETYGPFKPSFLADMAMVYNTLHSCWGKSSWWHHVKKFSKTKNGCQVYRTLHTLLLGGQQVVSTGYAICTKLQSFGYEGDHKNFNFDKYVNCQVEQHYHHSDLQEYRVVPLAKSLKTLWSQDEIRDPSLNAVRCQSMLTMPILLTLTL
jgi:hypothetical protein